MMTVGGNNTTMPNHQNPQGQGFVGGGPPPNVVIPQLPEHAPRRPCPEDAASYITVRCS
jgi:hypothetical protein